MDSPTKAQRRSRGVVWRRRKVAAGVPRLHLVFKPFLLCRAKKDPTKSLNKTHAPSTLRSHAFGLLFGRSQRGRQNELQHSDRGAILLSTPNAQGGDLSIEVLALLQHIAARPLIKRAKRPPDQSSACDVRVQTTTSVAHKSASVEGLVYEAVCHAASLHSLPWSKSHCELKRA